MCTVLITAECKSSKTFPLQTFLTAPRMLSWKSPLDMFVGRFSLFHVVTTFCLSVQVTAIQEYMPLSSCVCLSVVLHSTGCASAEIKCAHEHINTVIAPMLLPTGDFVTGRQQHRCIVPKLYIQSQSAPEDGRVCRPKHVEQIQTD